ncbi:very short patch repair endonuclease [Amycolatopsis sp. cg13]|uniref:very short patch repair endonuclease n=1 Tax=Amycolatopsis sp. cg13 TaxID=3238807 RepID=UPI0035235569
MSGSASDRTFHAPVDPVVSSRMSKIRSRDTKPELRLRAALHRRGLRYRIGVRPVGSVRRTADIVFGPSRVAVMVDGCFWHGCPEHHRPSSRNSGWWKDKIEGNIRRDRETDKTLGEAGWLVIRVWEHESAHEAAERIAEVVGQRRPPR